MKERAHKVATRHAWLLMTAQTSLAVAICGCCGGGVPLKVAGLHHFSGGSQPTLRVGVNAKTGHVVRMPVWNKNWRLIYQFVVPGLPTQSWDPRRQTFYIWGDIDFDAYGASGPYAISRYKYNQIVPQLFLGRVISKSSPAFAPVWNQQDTWAIQAQYFWQKGDLPYAQTGPVVGVDPGEVLTSTIDYEWMTGRMTASISGRSGSSTIVIDRPFPNEPQLFANWADFLKNAQAASKGDYVLAQPVMNVETNADAPTLCSVLPFVVRSINIPDVGTAASAFAQDIPSGLPCARAVSLEFHGPETVQGKPSQ